jgi:hypothetical protein
MGSEQVDDPIREQYARPVREHEQLLQDNDAALESVRRLRDDARAQGKETPTTDGMVDYLQDKHDQGTQWVQHERDNLDLYDQMTQPADGTLGQIDPTNPYDQQDPVRPIDTTNPYTDGGDAGTPYAGDSGASYGDTGSGGSYGDTGDGGDAGGSYGDGGDGSDDS